MPAAASRHHARQHDRAAHWFRRRPEHSGGHADLLADPEPGHLCRDLRHLQQLRACSRSATSTIASARGNNRNVEEEDKGVYLQADFKMDWGIPVRGDLGVRYVETDMTSQGYTPSGAQVLLVTAGNDYSDVLPSLNMVCGIHARPAAALRRGQGHDAAGAGLGHAGRRTSTWSAISASPAAIRCSIRRVPTPMTWASSGTSSEGGLLSGAIFYKDIKTFVQTVVENMPFNESGLPLESARRHDAHRHRSLRLQPSGEYRRRPAARASRSTTSSRSSSCRASGATSARCSTTPTSIPRSTT